MKCLNITLAVSWLNLTNVENPFRAKVDYFKETLEILLKSKNLNESAFNKMIQPCSCIELSCRAILTSLYLFLFGDLKNVVVAVGLEFPYWLCYLNTKVSEDLIRDVDLTML